MINKQFTSMPKVRQSKVKSGPFGVRLRVMTAVMLQNVTFPCTLSNKKQKNWRRQTLTLSTEM